MQTVTLQADEIEALDRQDADTKSDGGFEGLLVRLQNNLNRGTNELELTDADLEKIPRYAFDYKSGSWQRRLQATFSRTLGPKLGR